MIVQIYEIQTPDEAEALAALGVDHIGSVVVSKDNWRQPVIRETVQAAAAADARSSLILLYDDIDAVLRSIDYYRPDIVHFCEMLDHGKNRLPIENVCAPYVRLQAAVKQRFPETAIMRSIPIPAAGPNRDARAAFNQMSELAALFAPVSDYFLTDTLLVDNNGATDQPVSGFVGITGIPCDWGIAAELVRISPVPVILAGGLSPENVHAGIHRVSPAGVDSCTLTNAVDNFGRPIRFKKDMEKVRRFVAEARRR